MVFVPAIIIILLSRPIAWRPLILWTVAFAIAFYAYDALILEGRRSLLVRTQGQGIYGTTIDASGLLSSFIFAAQIIELPFRQFFLQGLPVIAHIEVGLLFVLPAIAFLLVCIIPIFLDQADTLNDQPQPHYVMYALFAWAVLYILTQTILPKFQLKFIFAMVLLLIFLAPAYANYKWIEGYQQPRRL